MGWLDGFQVTPHDTLVAEPRAVHSGSFVFPFHKGSPEVFRPRVGGEAVRMFGQATFLGSVKRGTLVNMVSYCVWVSVPHISLQSP